MDNSHVEGGTTKSLLHCTLNGGGHNTGTLHWKKLEVNLTQNGLPQLQDPSTSHFYHSLGLQPLSTQSSNMA